MFQDVRGLPDPAPWPRFFYLHLAQSNAAVDSCALEALVNEHINVDSHINGSLCSADVPGVVKLLSGAALLSSPALAWSRNMPLSADGAVRQLMRQYNYLLKGPLQ